MSEVEAAPDLDDDPVAQVIDKYLRSAGDPADYAWYLARECAQELRNKGLVT